MKKTPLYDTHVSLGASVGEFGGWTMPLWYKTGQLKEHSSTRETCGLFDICHMGEFIVTGKDSLEYWNKLLTNNVAKIKDGQANYNFMLNDNGGVVDDCLLYRYNDEKWMLVVNAGTQDGDFEWLESHAFGDVKVENIGDRTGKLDLQGPKAPKIVAKISGREAVEKIKFFRFVENFDLGGYNVTLSRTGYTGEIGFEIYCDIEDTENIWNLLMKEGEEFGITPVGLGARDTLRLEAGLPLHGHEIHPEIPVVGTPWEFAINYEHDFIGKGALEENRGRFYVYAISVEGRRKSGEHSRVIFNGEDVGEMTSEVLAVSLGKTPAGYIRVNCEMKVGDKIELKNGKGKSFSAVISENPLVKGTFRKKIAIFLNKD